MNSTLAPGRHLHVDIELNPENRFQYGNRGQDGRRLVLQRGDAVTFTCSHSFCIRFATPSPLPETTLHSHQESLLHLQEWFITSQVRDDAPSGEFNYSVELAKAGQIFRDELQMVVVSTEQG